MIRRHRSEAGQSLVEFSLSFIVFMMLVLGVVEVGRAVWSYNTLAEVAREGTRYAIVHGGKSSAPSGPVGNDLAVKTAAAKFAGSLDRDHLTVTSSWPDGNNQPGSRVTVSTTYSFHPLFSGMLGIGAFTLTSSSTMNITN